jgi:ligand-binding SRPBCC domain-containing protein
MKTFSFHAETRLPQPRNQVFEFFAEARNLEALTPPWLQFEVLTPAPIVMRQGTRIEYCIRIHGIPVRWLTEIAEWDPPNRFVDVQLKGPYVLWRHTHTLEEGPAGTLCYDDVSYRPRGGALLNRLFVRRDVERIFAYRQQRLHEMFGNSG